MEIISNLEPNDLMKVAQALVGHQTNLITVALEKYLLQADPELIRLDLKRLGIIQCKGCSIWWWEDQTKDGYCHSICGGEDVRKHEKRIETVGESGARSRKFSFSQVLRAGRER